MAASGGQPGNKNATKSKPWSDAINRALLAEDGQKLRALADKLIDRALEGDVSALKEVGDRMEGKPAQALEHSGKDGNAIQFERIERVIVDGKGE